MSDADALREYERTHWGRKGKRRVLQGRAADPRYGTAAIMGEELVSVCYRTIKEGDREPTEYEHEFAPGHEPALAYNSGGLIVLDGDYVIEEGGIKG